MTNLERLVRMDPNYLFADIMRAQQLQARLNRAEEALAQAKEDIQEFLEDLAAQREEIHAE